MDCSLWEWMPKSRIFSKGYRQQQDFGFGAISSEAYASPVRSKTNLSRRPP
jgi:hypothetical protein